MSEERITISQREFIDLTGGPDRPGPFDEEAHRLTKLAASTVRALEAHTPGCSETNNIGFLGTIRSALESAYEQGLNARSLSPTDHEPRERNGT